ncbi:unnamed protein product [Choristocarpus tenellus]
MLLDAGGVEELLWLMTFATKYMNTFVKGHGRTASPPPRGTRNNGRWYSEGVDRDGARSLSPQPSPSMVGLQAPNEGVILLQVLSLFTILLKGGRDGEVGGVIAALRSRRAVALPLLLRCLRRDYALAVPEVAYAAAEYLSVVIAASSGLCWDLVGAGALVFLLDTLLARPIYNESVGGGKGVTGGGGGRLRTVDAISKDGTMTGGLEFKGVDVLEAESGGGVGGSQEIESSLEGNGCFDMNEAWVSDSLTDVFLHLGLINVAAGGEGGSGRSQGVQSLQVVSLDLLREACLANLVALCPLCPPPPIPPPQGGPVLGGGQNHRLNRDEGQESRTDGMNQPIGAGAGGWNCRGMVNVNGLEGIGREEEEEQERMLGDVMSQLLTPGLHRLAMADAREFIRVLRSPGEGDGKGGVGTVVARGRRWGSASGAGGGSPVAGKAGLLESVGAVRTPLVVWTSGMMKDLEATLRQEASRVDGAAAAGIWPLWAVDDVCAAEGYKFQYPSLASAPIICGLYIDLVATADRQSLSRSLDIVQVSPMAFLAALDDTLLYAQSTSRASLRMDGGNLEAGEVGSGSDRGVNQTWPRVDTWVKSLGVVELAALAEKIKRVREGLVCDFSVMFDSPFS